MPEEQTKPFQRKRKSRRQSLSGEALQIVEERREAKSKGVRERYIESNTEFQKRTKRYKSTFFNEQCLIIEENNKKEKIRDLFRKTGNIKLAFCPKMGTIEDKNGSDLVDAKEIKKRWKEYMEELYKEDLNELDYYDGVVSHPESDILECEVKWALRSTVVKKKLMDAMKFQQKYSNP